MNLNIPRRYLLLVPLATIFSFISPTQAAQGVACETDNDCGETQGLIRGFSVCENGKCTNPFELGCLNVMSERYGKKETQFPSLFEETRICNSDDHNATKTSAEGDTKRCREQKLADYFLYDEVRIAPSNWEGAIVASWIYQIMLMELLEVPTTMENGNGINGKGSFYDRHLEFVYPKGGYESGIHETLLESERLQGNCSKAEIPCAHILPDVWESGVDPELHSKSKTFIIHFERYQVFYNTKLTFFQP